MIPDDAKMENQPGEEMLMVREQAQQQSGGLPGVIESIINWRLSAFVYPNKRGWVFGADTEFEAPGFRKRSKSKRRTDNSDDNDEPGRKQPDVAFISVQRLPAVPRGPVPMAPDLAVEVYSENDSPYSMSDKVKEYLGAGVRQVWVVNPPDKLITVYKPGMEQSVTLGVKDEIDGEDVLPGFKLRLSEVFGEVIEKVDEY